MKQPNALLAWLRVATFLAAVGCTRQAAVSSTLAVEPTAAPTKGRALLVGVTVYPNLGDGYQLHGPANDVVLMRGLLQDKFGFAPENIVTLSEEEGKKDAEHLPTRANIEREFTRIGKTAQAGEQVVLFLSGHGSQQPEAADSKEPKPNGLDEIFLPRDVGQWDDGKAVVANAILDHEIGHWIKPIQDAKASLWVVFDSCHSGTMIRGVGERARQVANDAPDGLNIPKAALAKAKERSQERLPNGPKTRGKTAPEPPIKLADPGGVAALYACQPAEVTIEFAMPADSADARPYGLLTYTINKILNRATGPVTYRELAQRVHDEYVALGRTSPTPLLEGNDRDREVLGMQVWEGRSKFVIAESADGLKVNAGALHGLTQDSILAVYPPPDKGDPKKLLGHVKIGKVGIHDSEVVPCEYDNTPAPAKTDLVGARCEPVFIDYGDLRLPVGVDEQDGQGKAVPPEERRRLADLLDKIAKEPGALIRAVERPAKADWWIRWQAGKVFLVPDAEWSRKEAAGKGVDGLLGPVEAGEKLGGWLKDSLGKIARAENLKRLASNPGEEIARGTGDLDAKVTVEVLRRRDETDKKGQAVEWPAGGRPAFYDGDLLTIRLSNPGRIPVDVTLLYVDSGFGIDALFPSKDKGELNRLEAGDCVRIDLDVEASTAGLENLVVIAVKGEGQPADFVSLAQPTIALAEKDVTKRGIDAARGLNSPLGRLLQNALYGEGGTRAVKRPKGNTDHLIKRLSWQIEPVKRPVEDK